MDQVGDCCLSRRQTKLISRVEIELEVVAAGRAFKGLLKQAAAAVPPGFENASENVFRRTDVQLIFIGIYTLVFVFAFFGNLTVLLVILKNKTRQITKLCLTNLAIADFCVGVFCIYQNLSMYLAEDWIFGLWLCKLYWFITSLSHTASVLILIVVCIERYVAIMYPMRCRQLLTNGRLKSLLLFVWVTSAAYSCPKLYYTGIQVHRRFDSLDPQGNPMLERICTLDRSIFNSRTFDTVNSVALFLLPLLVMTVLYARIGYYFYSQRKFGFRDPGASSSVVQYSGTAATTVRPEEEAPSDSEQGEGEEQEEEKEREQIKKKKKRITSDDESNEETQTFEEGQKISISFRNARKTPVDSAAAMVARRERISKSRKQITCMLIVLVLAFAICNLPFHFRKFLLYVDAKPRLDFNSVWTNLMLPMTQLAMYANSAVNPIIYFFMSSYFRKSFQRAFYECV